MVDEAPTLDHPAEESWAEFVAAREEDAALRRHLAGCAACRALVAELRADETAFAELRAAHAADPFTALDRTSLPEVAGYRIERELHRGGQGIVYEALQLATRRKVALKVLLDGALASSEKRLRFLREIDLAAGLRHPGIVTVYDSGTTEDGRLCYAMELVQGVPLDEHAAARRDWELAELLELFQRVCAAVDHAHQRGVIHRDLKPDNVLVDAAGEPRVLDFGLARPAAAEGAGDETLSRSGWFLGTLAYAAPEQVRGDLQAIGVRTDVHALGLLLYELLTGSRPFAAGRDVSQLARAILETDPPAPSAAMRRGAPRGPRLRGDAELDTIVLRALAKEPARRYPSAGELGRDLARYLRNEPLYARRDSTWYLVRKLLRRHRLPFAAAAVFVLVCVSAAAISTTFWRRSVRHSEALAAEAGKLAKVGGLFERMLTSVRPDRAKGRDVRARDVLDEARAQLASELPDEPLVAAAFLRVLGRSYLALELVDEAEREFALALELRRSAGESGGALAELVADLGEVELARERFEAAEGRFDEVELLARLRPAECGLALARALKGRALVAHYRGEREAADALAAQARDLLVAEGAGELAAEAWGDVGRFLLDRGLLDEAQDALEQSARAWEELGDPRRIARAEALERLGALSRRKGELEQALARFSEALSIVEELLGAQHVSATIVRARLVELRCEREGWAAVAGEASELLDGSAALVERRGLDAAAALDALARLAQEGGDFARSAELFRAALERYEELGAEHPWAAVCRDSLAWQLYQRGELAEAQRLSREALAAYRASGRRDETLAQLVHHSAWIVGSGSAGDRERSVALAEESLALFEELHGPRHASVASALFSLGFFLEGSGRLDEAEPLLEEAYVLRRELLGEEHVDVARCLYALGELLLARGDAPGAESRHRECLELRRRLFGADHPEVASSLDALGATLLARGELDESGRLLQEAVDMFTRHLGADSPRLLKPISDHQRWCSASGDEAGIERDLELALAIQVVHYGESDPRTQRTLQRLVEQCRRLGHEARAREHAARLVPGPE